ncbi:hypothetical protein ACYOEI_28545 [Singulisphaera rosea]
MFKTRLHGPSGLRSAAVVFSWSLITCLGCGDDSGLPPRIPVSGNITYKGTPVENGMINFAPVDPEGRAASGQIENGRYALTTIKNGDGALPGKYKVTVTSKSIDTTELKAIAKGGQFHHDKAFAKSVKNAKNLVPSKYSLADTSGLEFEVSPSTNNFDKDLTD